MLNSISHVDKAIHITMAMNPLICLGSQGADLLVEETTRYPK